MKKTLLSLALAGLATGAWAQQDQTAMKYAKIITPELEKMHLSIIASDEYEGRETGMPGAAKAADYIANEFKSLGLKPIVNGSYFFDVPIMGTRFMVNGLTINGTAYNYGKDFTAQGGGTKTINVNDVVFIGYGIGDEKYDDLKGIDITGKVVVLMSNGEPMKDSVSFITGKKQLSAWSPTPGAGGRGGAGGGRGGAAGGNTAGGKSRMQYIQSKNPALILTVNPNPPSANGRGGRGGVPTPPERWNVVKKQEIRPFTGIVSYTISIPMADQLLKPTGKTLAQLKSAIDQSGVPQSQAVKTELATSYAAEVKDLKANDVLGFMEGSDPKLKDEVLVVSGHYDHIGLTNPGSVDKVNNGADDDGSGTTGMMSIARAFSQAKKAGKGPRRSILFLANVGEEKGLLGSEYYTDHPVIPMEKTVADLNIDMIGRVGTDYKGKPDSANYVYVIGSKMLSSDLYNMSVNANKTYTNMTLDYVYDDPNDRNRFYYRSDHYNFAKHNVPIIFYFNGTHEDYHQPGDEVKKINFPLMAKRAQLVFYTAWAVANADKRPVVDGKNDR